MLFLFILVERVAFQVHDVDQTTLENIITFCDLE